MSCAVAVVVPPQIVGVAAVLRRNVRHKAARRLHFVVPRHTSALIRTRTYPTMRAGKASLMNRTLTGASHDGALVSAALRAVRRHRRMTPAEVADRMNMPLRTYQRFEAGEARLNHDHIHRFAAATDSDARAIFFALTIGSPELAWRAADNRLGTVLAIGLQKFDEQLGDAVHDLDTRTLVAAVTRMFDDLANTRPPSDPAAAWLRDGTETLAARRPRPGR